MSLFPLSLTVDMRQVPMQEIAMLGHPKASALSFGVRAAIGSALGVLLALLLVWRFGPMTYNKEFFRLSLPIALGLIGATLAARDYNAGLAKKLWDDLQNAPFYAKPKSFELTHDGVRGFEVNMIEWSLISQILEYSSGVALLYTPAHYVPIPDRALPDGVSRTALLTEIKAHLL